MDKIVSGGQTGVDRGALDACLDAGFPCGGWCPEGRLAEDGPIPDRYPLRTLPGAGYRERTIRNVIDCDGTAILHAGEVSGGTELTLLACERHRKPHVVVDGAALSPAQAAEVVAGFVREHAIGTLNVAGPRGSKWAKARDFAFEVVSRLITREHR